MNREPDRHSIKAGATGGQESRRSSTPDTPAPSDQVREARQAFREFRAMCFWSYRRDLEIGPADVDWVAETLKRNGNMRAWRAAGRLCR